jgi:hypothetical protein
MLLSSDSRTPGPCPSTGHLLPPRSPLQPALLLLLPTQPHLLLHLHHLPVYATAYIG